MCDPSGAFLQTLLTQQVFNKSKLSKTPVLRYVLLLILNVHTSPAPNDRPSKFVPRFRSNALDLDLILTHMRQNYMLRTITGYYK